MALDGHSFGALWTKQVESMHAKVLVKRWSQLWQQPAKRRLLELRVHRQLGLQFIICVLDAAL